MIQQLSLLWQPRNETMSSSYDQRDATVYTHEQCKHRSEINQFQLQAYKYTLDSRGFNYDVFMKFNYPQNNKNKHEEIGHPPCNLTKDGQIVWDQIFFLLSLDFRVTRRHRCYQYCNRLPEVCSQKPARKTTRIRLPLRRPPAENPPNLIKKKLIIDTSKNKSSHSSPLNNQRFL